MPKLLVQDSTAEVGGAQIQPRSSRLPAWAPPCTTHVHSVMPRTTCEGGLWGELCRRTEEAAAFLAFKLLAVFCLFKAKDVPQGTVISVLSFAPRDI